MTKQKQRTVIISVINDLVTDRRVDRTCMEFHRAGFKVILVGRKLNNSLPIETRPYACFRMKLLFNKGPAFYIVFQLRLFFLLLFRKTDVLFSNDLDTLAPNFFVSKMKRKLLVYDSHELFCEVPELTHSPGKRKLWLKLEAFLVPKLTHALTVNQSIADWFRVKYSVPFRVLRNIPDLPLNLKIRTKQELGLPQNKKIIILQGAGINIDRGAEEAVLAMKYVNDCILLIIGGGDVIEVLKSIIIEHQLSDRVIMKGKMPSHELFEYTSNSDIGLSIDKDNNLNYRFSLPNKLFDYMHAGIPILSSRLPEIEKIIKTYNIGSFIDNHQPEHIAERMKFMLMSSEYSEWRKNTKNAAKENNWEIERSVLRNLIQELSNQLQD